MPSAFTAHCQGCPYRNNDHLTDTDPRLPLSMEYRPGAVALLILQAPGSQEWDGNRPICSTSPRSAAAKIKKSLTRIGAQRGDFSITNAVQCYPGVGSDRRDKRPRKRARQKCMNWLKMDIRRHLSPPTHRRLDVETWRRVVVFGAEARESVEQLGYGNDSRFRFVVHPSGGLSNSNLDAALCWSLGRQ